MNRNAILYVFENGTKPWVSPATKCRFMLRSLPHRFTLYPSLCE